MVKNQQQQHERCTRPFTRRKMNSNQTAGTARSRKWRLALFSRTNTALNKAPILLSIKSATVSECKPLEQSWTSIRDRIELSSTSNISEEDKEIDNSNEDEFEWQDNPGTKPPQQQNNSRCCSSTTATSSNSATKSVSFSNATVHYHSLILGDNPSVSTGGPPLALGAECVELCECLSLNEEAQEPILPDATSSSIKKSQPQNTKRSKSNKKTSPCRRVVQSDPLILSPQARKDMLLREGIDPALISQYEQYSKLFRQNPHLAARLYPQYHQTTTPKNGPNE